MNSNNTALILIDLQKLFFLDDNNRTILPLEDNVKNLLGFFRESDGLVIHVVHDSLEENSLLKKGLETAEIVDFSEPTSSEIVIEKNVNSAFIGTNLEKILRDVGIDNLVFVGMTTPHCVSTSVRMAGNLGFSNFIISDGIGALDLNVLGKTLSAEDVHESALLHLEGEFGRVLSCNEFLELV